MQIRHFSIPAVLIFLFFFSLASAQEGIQVQRSAVKETIQGKDFYIHTVKSGETLFGISRAYQVSIDEMRVHNFALSEGIVPGQIIKIPVVEVPQLIEGDLPAQGTVNYRRVGQGETLYSISREFGITVEEIMAANNGLPEGLKTGMFLKIPVKQDSSKEFGRAENQDEKTKNFVEYQAKERITVYDLALRYRVSVDSILHYNKGIDEQLRSGQIIRIPIIDGQAGYITHTVTKRETLVRLARKYNMDVNLIRSINPYLARHLSAGQVVKIPLLKMDVDDVPTPDKLVMDTDDDAASFRPKSLKEMCHESYTLGSFKVALLLPLYFSTVDSLIQHAQVTGQEYAKSTFIKPFTFIQFYQGFMMAVDSLEKAGLNVRIYVFNLENDIMQTRQLLQNPELKQMDLIIGPFFSQNFKLVADFAKEHRINIVNPLSTREEVTVGNPYVFQPQPLRNSQFDALVDYLNEKHGYSQIFIARHNPYQDFAAFERLQSVLNKQLEPRKIPSTSLFHEIVYSRDSLFTFVHTASVNHENVVVAFGENKLFILDMMRKLNQLRDTFQITVVGMPNWREIEGLEYEHLNNLNTHFIAEQFINYKKPVVRNFVSKFYETYAADPGIYAFNGFNMGAYFLGALMKYGRNFNECVPYFSMELLNMGYEFETSHGRGYNNVNWKIQKIDRYQLKDITKTLPVYDLSKPPKRYYQYMNYD